MQRGTSKQHKLRKLDKRSDGSFSAGITLPVDKVGHLMDVYFVTHVSGTAIILESGSKV